MLNHLANIRFMGSTNFSQKAFDKIEHAADEPIFPKHANPGTKRCCIGLDHTKCAVKTPGEKEDEEEVVGIPEPLKVFPTGFFEGCKCHCHEDDKHDVASCSWAGTEVDEKEALDASAGGHC